MKSPEESLISCVPVLLPSPPVFEPRRKRLQKDLDLERVAHQASNVGLEVDAFGAVCSWEVYDARAVGLLHKRDVIRGVMAELEHGRVLGLP